VLLDQRHVTPYCFPHIDGLPVRTDILREPEEGGFGTVKPIAAD
jgi:hypothetical protein